jgi:2-iminobutanoate/2-iminopropanoate deaminase
VSARLGLALALAVTWAAAGCRIEERTDRPRGQTQAVPPRRQVVGSTAGETPPLASPAVRSGDLVLLSGVVGSERGAGPPRLVEGGAAEEARRALDRIGEVLASAGGSLADVVSCTVFLADLQDSAALDSAWAARFPSEPPARTVVAVSALPLGARVQLECVAAWRAAR